MEPTTEVTSLPTTAADYALAVQNLPSGRFTASFPEHVRQTFAAMYGAPIYAASVLAPEILTQQGVELLIEDRSTLLANEGGRWLSLYARVLQRPGTFRFMVCVPRRPRRINQTRPVLFQPPQSIVTTPWTKHLRDSDASLTVPVAYCQTDFDRIHANALEVCSAAPGRKVLLSAATRIEALLIRHLHELLGCTTSSIIPFEITKGTPQEFSPGAWWFSATPPVGAGAVYCRERDIKRLRRAYSFVETFVYSAGDASGIAERAKVYASRSSQNVDGEVVDVVNIRPGEGINTKTGRIFALGDTQLGSAAPRDGNVVGAQMIAVIPPGDGAVAPDEDRLQLLLWLSETLAELDHLENSHHGDRAETNPSSARESDETGEAPESEADSMHAPVADRVLDPEEAHSAPWGPDTDPHRYRLSRGAGPVNVAAVAARLGNSNRAPGDEFASAMARALTWLADKGFVIPDPAANVHLELPTGELFLETDGQSVWSIRFDDRRSIGQGAFWRVELTVIDRPYPAISMRLTQVRSGEDAPPPVASGVPTVLAEIAETVGLQDAGETLSNSAIRLTGNDGAQSLMRLLLNTQRAQPVIVISGPVDSSAERLAKRTTGLAHVIRIDDTVANSLIHRFGRDRAVYGNAVRLYRPGFDPASDRFEHPVWELKGTQLPKRLVTDIFEQACAISVNTGDLDERAPSFEVVRNHLAQRRLDSSENRLEKMRVQLEDMRASKNDHVDQLVALRAELESSLSGYKTRLQQLEVEISQLSQELRATRRERDAAMEEARQLRYRLNEQWVPEDVEVPELPDDSYYPETWDDLETWIDVYGGGKLVILPSAAKAARESPFKDIPLAYKALEYLVRYYIPMRERGEHDCALREASQAELARIGLELSKVGTALKDRRYRQDYRGRFENRDIVFDQHLKSGVGHDPTTIFRLYFSYDDAMGKVIVGHMPTHLTNRDTHNG